MKHVQFFRMLIVIAIIAVTPALLFGQAVNFASIHGRVADKSDAAVAGAEVKATQVATGLVRTTTTTNDGNFTLPSLPVGEYKVQVSAKGFKDYRQTGIILTVGSSAAINASLEVGAITETVEVHADAAMVETHENSISSLIDNSRIVEMPLNGRNLPGLMMLVGGASDNPVPSNDLNSSKNYGNGLATGGPSVTISVGGGQANANNYLLDGADHNDGFSNVNAPFPFPDAVQEFSIQSSGTSARFGVHSGATVTAVTKSGTNNLHGTAFEFLRNPLLNAHHVQFPTGVPLGRDDTMKRNQFGGTLGGPIKKDKLLFFVGYQGTRQVATPGATSATVPTTAMLNGDFSTIMSAACQGAGKAKTLNSNGFVNNHIDPTLFNAQSLALLKMVPIDTSAAGCGKISYTIPQIWNEDQGVAKVDYNLSSTHSIFARYFGTDSRVPVTFDGKNILTQSVASQFSRYQSQVIGDTYTFASGYVNSLRLVGTRLAINRGPANNLPNPASLGINVPSPVDAGIVISIGSYFNVAGGSQMPGHFINNLFQVADDVDVVRGRHQISFGANFMKMQLNYISNVFTNGQFTFNAQGSSLTIDNMADFMTGHPSNFQQGNAEAENWRYTYAGFYVHDNIRLRSNLSVNAGIRWEPYLPSKDAMDRGSHFDMNAFMNDQVSKVFTNAPAGLLFCGDKGIPCSFANHKLADFSPRFGMIWDPRGKGRETIRAGYGLFYDSPEMYYFDRYADNSPFGSATSFTPSAAGGFTNPYLGQSSIPVFPQAFPTQGSGGYFPNGGTYINNSFDIHPTYVQSWNLALEKQFGANWSVSATYLGSKTTHIWQAYEGNPGLDVAVGTNTLGCTVGAASTKNTACRRALYVAGAAVQSQFGLTSNPGAAYGFMTSLWDGANSNYNGLLLTAKHRFSNNFTVMTNYTWSHCLGDADFSGELTNSRPTLSPTPWVIQPDGHTMDYGNCAFDVRQSVNASVVMNSPKIQSKALGMILNNWQLAPLVTYRTGTPFTLLTGADTGLTAATTSFKDRPNQVGDPFAGTCTRTLTDINGNKYSQTFAVGDRNCYFNPAAFAVPTVPTGIYGPMGNVSRDSFMGPGAFKFDASVSRKIAVSEGKVLQLRFEAFNLFNHPNLNNPGTSLSSIGTLGQITGQNGDGRILQGAVKFTF